LVIHLTRPFGHRQFLILAMPVNISITAPLQISSSQCRPREYLYLYLNYTGIHTDGLTMLVAEH